jgi:hypothetical protein
MAKSETRDVVMDFIEGSLSDEGRELYALAAKIDYPIDDARTFRKAVDAATKGGSGKPGDLLKKALPASAFPIMSVQGALEKLDAALPAELRIVPTAHRGLPHPTVPPAASLPPGALLPPGASRAVDAWAHTIACAHAAQAYKTSCQAGVPPGEPEHHACEVRAWGVYRSCLAES